MKLKIHFFRTIYSTQLLVLILLGFHFLAFSAYAFEVSRICPSEQNHSQYLKIYSYRDGSFRVEYCNLGTEDSVACLDIKGFGKDGKFAQGNPAMTLPLLPAVSMQAPYDKNLSQQQFRATLLGRVKELEVIKEREKKSIPYPSIKYISKIFGTDQNPRECHILPGNFDNFVRELTSEIGTIRPYENLEAKKAFVSKVVGLESEKHSVRTQGVFSGKLWYTRANGGFLIHSDFLPRPEVVTPLSFESLEAQ